MQPELDRDVGRSSATKYGQRQRRVHALNAVLHERPVLGLGESDSAQS